MSKICLQAATGPDSEPGVGGIGSLGAPATAQLQFVMPKCFGWHAPWSRGHGVVAMLSEFPAAVVLGMLRSQTTQCGLSHCWCHDLLRPGVVFGVSARPAADKMRTAFREKQQCTVPPDLLIQ